MMRLLVSVRDAEEARIAIDAGVDLIDVKEPLRGALGAADAGQIAAVVREVAGRVPVSAALGELFADDAKGVGSQFRNGCDTEFEIPSGAKLTPDPLGLQFAKFGLAGATLNPRWRDLWAEAIRQLPPGVKGVAVAYADWRTCNAPPPRDVLEFGISLRCAAFLIDTYDKTCGGLPDHCPLSELKPLLETAENRGLLTVLGGSLDIRAIQAIAPLQPDFAAVRTAVCTSNRAGRLDETRVRELVEFIAQLQCEYAMRIVQKFA